jgi:hypothetical protein
MKCLRCESSRTFSFIDGFGERRVFCKNCGGSFLENRAKEFDWQKNLQQFNLVTYHRLGFHG